MVARLVAFAFVWLALPSAVGAQWIQYPDPGAPRLADGSVNRAAPAPRMPDGKPDFSGVWQVATLLPCDDVRRMCTDLPISLQFTNIGAGVPGGLPYQQWAKDRMASRGPADDPYVRCITPGGPRMILLPTMKKFVQTPRVLMVLSEYNTHYRQVFLDARPLPQDPNPTWNGYSSGRWDADTLVVTSNGYRDDQWLDTAGSPLTSAARVTERLRRRDYGHLQVEVTVDDAVAYTRPWTVSIDLALVPDTDLLDANCWENEKDVPHLLNAK